MESILQNWSNATIGQKCLVGLYTTIIAMGIVFLVLYILELIIKLQSKVIESFEKKTVPNTDNNYIKAELDEVVPVEKKGITDGESVLVQVESEEVAAVIMAAVCQYSNIPISKLKIKSIKAI